MSFSTTADRKFLAISPPLARTRTGRQAFEPGSLGADRLIRVHARYGKYFQDIPVRDEPFGLRGKLLDCLRGLAGSQQHAPQEGEGPLVAGIVLHQVPRERQGLLRPTKVEQGCGLGIAEGQVFRFRLEGRIQGRERLVRLTLLEQVARPPNLWWPLCVGFSRLRRWQDNKQPDHSDKKCPKEAIHAATLEGHGHRRKRKAKVGGLLRNPAGADQFPGYTRESPPNASTSARRPSRTPLDSNCYTCTSTSRRFPQSCAPP